MSARADGPPSGGEEQGSIQDDAGAAAGRGSLGDVLRQLAQAAQEASQAASQAARPHVEEAARRAREAVNAARPLAEQALSDTARYTREHEHELRRAAAAGAGAAARVATPAPLRPALDAFEQGLRVDREVPDPTGSPAIPGDERGTSPTPPSPDERPES